MYNSNMTFEKKVKFIFFQCTNTDDCYYLVKALYNEGVREILYNSTFLNSNKARSIRDLIFGELSQEDIKNECELNRLENQSTEQ